MTTLVRALAALGLVFATWLLWGARSRDEAMRASIVQIVMKHPWLTAGALASALLALTALTVISGVVPIKASSGHWRITEWLLDFAKTRSVATHSWGIETPPLDDDALVVRGAGHYEGVCLPCHGGPGSPALLAVRAMTPAPPELTDRIARWAPEELFTIVKHGIKFTAMPAWPVQQRDDEVWSMVAFLRRLPQLDPVEYRSLAFGATTAAAVSPQPAGPDDVALPPAVRDVCWRCHGADGTGRGRGAFPSLSGQRSDYLANSLRAFRDGSRFSALMGEVAAKLDDDAIRDVAEYYERLPPRGPEASNDIPARERGRAIAVKGIPERDIPACVECHGPTAFPKNRAYPQLTAQHADYLSWQLSLLQQRRRGGTPNVDLMHVFVSRLREPEIDAVTAFYAALPMNVDPSVGR